MCEGKADTGRVETVYNLEVEGDHTYFVGCNEWVWAVWAHNAYDPAGYGPHALEWTDINLRPKRKFAVERGEHPSPLGTGLDDAHLLSAINPKINRDANHLYVVDENGKVVIREFQGPQDRGPHSGLLLADQQSQVARVAGELHIAGDDSVRANLKSGHFMRDNPLTLTEASRFQELMNAEIEAAGFRVGRIHVGRIHTGVDPVW